MSHPDLSDAQLLQLAGKAALVRGRRYCADGLVRLAQVSDVGVKGEAYGSATYPLWLKRDGDDLAWRWNCACPAADDGSFCKHLVAAVLTARDGASKDAVARTSRDELFEFLRAQSAERLAGWLKTLADEDAAVEKRLRLFRAADDPVALKTALGKMLNPGGFLDYRASLRYAKRLDAVVEQLESQLARDAAVCRALCEYVIGRLLKIYGRSDDSAGVIGERLREVAALHARACAAAPPGKALARPLFAMQQKDEWDLLPLADYWDALGTDGQTEYGRLIAAELQRLPEHVDEQSRHGETFGIRARAQAYARASGDFELLQRVLRGDLSSAYGYLLLVESYREFGREREALNWAEHAVKLYPSDKRLRVMLAGCLQAAGLDEEASEQCWQRFQLRPDSEAWDRLKRSVGSDWPSWRERALQAVAARECNDEATQRVELLLQDGDLAAAVTLANQHQVRLGTLNRLAQRLEPDDPETAGTLYLRVIETQMQALDYASYPRLVSLLQRAARLLPASRWRPLLEQIHAVHGRKTRLMSLLAEAGF